MEKSKVKYPELVVAVVDDQKTCLSILRKCIMNENLFSVYNIHCFISPFECMKFVQNNKIHLLITDFCMPIITGDRLVRDVKKLDLKVKTILFSSEKVRSCVGVKEDLNNFADIIMEKVSGEEMGVLIGNVKKTMSGIILICCF